MRYGDIGDGAQYLSKRDVSILKGFGILLIFLHNYFHWQSGLSIENEFIFRTSNFTTYLTHAFKSPLDFFRYSVAYFGHFGVQLFILTSAYGLYSSAQRKQHTESYFEFLVPRLIKIFSLLLLGALVIALVKYLRQGDRFDPVVIASIVFFRITSIWNLSYDTIFNHSGPFWFFGVIVQLYVVFPILNKLVARWPFWKDLVFVLIVSVLNMMLYPLLRGLNVPLMGQFIGHLPLFMLGLMLAKHGYRPSLVAVAACIVCFALGQVYQVFFTATFISIGYLMITAFFSLKLLKGLSATRIPWLLEALGSISMAVFVINGPLRTLPLFQDENGNLLTDRFFLFTAILILASIPVAFLFKKLNSLLLGFYSAIRSSKLQIR